jgi:imidazolonepropionase-like amidohydrolase
MIVSRSLHAFPLLCLIPQLMNAQFPRSFPGSASIVDSGTIVVHMLERRIGQEIYELRRDGEGFALSSKLALVDRNSPIQLDAALQTRGDFTPRHFHAQGKTYRFVNVDIDVAEADGRTRIINLGDTSVVATQAQFFTSRGYAPLAARALLIRYWESHSRPRSLANLPGPADAITIEHRGADTVQHRGVPMVLRRYSVEGVVWGREAVWLDNRGRFVALLTRIHILPLEAIREDMLEALPQLQASAIRDRTADLAILGRKIKPLADGVVALVGGRVVTGTDAPPIDDAVVVIRSGRIVAVGPRVTVRVPREAKVVDTRGKTILPGLWDMHGHLSQIEWGPAYLAAGVTSARDMGGEAPFLLALQNAFTQPDGLGPRLLLAGLIDGPGPNAFGSTVATTPEEGVALVDRYYEQHFQQIKLYNSISAPVAGAVIRRAHSLQMTVAGHVPRALGLRAAVDSGLDHIAHWPFSGEEPASELQALVDFLARKHTVLDPTIAWNELLGRSPMTPVSAFEKGIAETPSPLRLNYESVRNMADSAEANADRDQGFRIFKALHDAGVPLIAGTDGGIPGHSLFREIELSVAAGLTPLEAVQTATTVPAKAMGLESEVGTVTAGRLADLLILDADPLANIGNIRTGWLVVTRGRVYDCRELWRAAGFGPQK